MLDQVITRRRGIAAGVLVVLLALPVVGCKPAGYVAPADVTKVVIGHVGASRPKVYTARDGSFSRIVSLYNEAERVPAPNMETTPDYSVVLETRQGVAAAVVFSFGDPVLGVDVRDGERIGIVSEELQELAREATE